MKRFPEIRMLEEPTRSYSIFIKGYEEMKVVIPRRNWSGSADMGATNPCSPCRWRRHWHPWPLRR